MTDDHEGRPATMSGDGRDRIGDLNKIDIFQHLQTTFSSTQRERPPAMEFPGEDSETRIPLKENTLHRRESKSGLRRMFTRSKVDKKVVLPVLEEPPERAVSDKQKPVDEKFSPRTNSLKRPSTVPAPDLATPSTPKAASKPSRMNLRSKSVKYGKPAPKPSPKSSTKSFPKPPTRTSAAWDPPPLFQAYPQAIKHATLLASTLSADSILRISNDNKTNSLRDDFAQSRPDVVGPEQTPAAKKAEKAKSKHRRQISGSISKADWTHKIFVLVTSGYLLQYAGEGSFDRLPEKMMQLGKDSVAFASDVIPGKHWVLQISQSMNADGTPTADSRSLLSRLTFRGADYRRTATSLLLVLNSADDMDSWIAVVRREIESLGGKKHVSETGKSRPDDKVMQLTAQPSHRDSIQRDFKKLSNHRPPSNPPFAPSWANDEQVQERLEDAASDLGRPLSIMRPSTGHQSISNSIVSHDGRQLDSLRDSAIRLSVMSSGQRTLITSQSSSTASSPIRDSYSSFDEIPPKIPVEDVRPRPNAAAINERRRSMQTMQIPLLDAAPQPKNFRHSTFVMPNRPSSSHSQTPNFSTPKRLSRILIPETSSVPTIATAICNPSHPRDSILKGTRKGPPVALAVARSLSPVEDSPSPGLYAPQLFIPADSSSNMVQQVKASVISIPPRSPTASTPVSPVDLPRRIAGLMPVASNETSQLDFQFPKRFPSLQSLRDAIDSAPQPPLRPAPLPPAALTTPLPVSPYLPGDEPKMSHNANHELENEKERLSPLPILANSKQKLRRPISMQLRPPSATSFTATARSPKTPLVAQSHQSSSVAPSPGSSHIGTTSPASMTIVSPSSQRLKLQAHPKAVANRKSMPKLVNGPPPAPPPDCALPPLPPGSAGSRGPVATRNSVRA